MYTNVLFDCECGSTVEYMAYFPAVIADTEKEKDDFRESDQSTDCDSCGRPYTLTIKYNFYENDVSVNHGDIPCSTTTPHYEEDELDIIYNKESPRITIFREQVRTVKLLLSQPVDKNALYGLHIMLHAHLVAAAEGYLFATFLHNVTNSDKLIRKLVETDPEFSNKKFSLSEIFISQESLKQSIEKYLKELIFHKLSKTKEMYQSVLGYDFGEIRWFYRAVSLRHHCVHRAGYDLNGQPLDISKDSILSLMEKLSSLTESIELRVQDFDEDGNRILGRAH